MATNNKIYWQVEHVRTLAELPAELVKGRAYFVSQENYLVIDHGDGLGPQVYGNRPGIQGPPGEPVPEMLSDIEQLGKAIIKTQRIIVEIREQDTKRFQEIREQDNKRFDEIQAQNDAKFDELENMLAGLLAVTAQKLNIDLDEIRQAAEDETNNEDDNN